MINKKHDPKLVINDARKPRRVLSTLLSELSSCDSFRFYVAFVNQQGVASLLQSLMDLEERNIQGKILVSKYLNFTEPTALRSLLKFDNIELRIMTKDSMHSKGYFFENNNSERYVIGSSNWTASALSKNTELNVIIETESNSALAQDIEEEFKHNFKRSDHVTELLIKEIRTRT